MEEKEELLEDIKDHGTSHVLAGGGAGNPTGNSYTEGNYWKPEYTDTVKNGTGGLLTIYSKDLKNYGNIYSDGIGLGKLILRNNNSTVNGYYVAAGGSSGGGSINIFFNGEYINEGKMSVNGGNLSYTNNGGPGGTGSISIGQLLNGTYTSTYTNY